MEYNRKFISSKKYPDVSKCYLDDIFTGYLKNQVWSYENEMRIIIEFKHSLPEIATIAIDFSGALQNISITSSPCNSTDSLKMFFANEKFPLSKKYPNIDIKDSYHKGFLHFRKRCDACTYNEDERKRHCSYRQRWSPNTKG